MMDIELLAAAHHEAGHVAVAHAIDCRVDGLEVFWSDLGRWFGRSPVGLSKDKLDGLQAMMMMDKLSSTGAKVALAGMLAQAKFLALHQFGVGTRFDTKADLSELEVFLRDNKRTETSPGSAVISFVHGESVEGRTLDLSGFVFSTEDSKAFNYYLARVESVTPKALVIETMRMINDDLHWMRIEALVDLLLKQVPTGDDKRRFLTADQLLSALSA